MHDHVARDRWDRRHEYERDQRVRDDLAEAEANHEVDRDGEDELVILCQNGPKEDEEGAEGQPEHGDDREDASNWVGGGGGGGWGGG